MAFPCKLGLKTVFLLLQEGCNVALWICSLLATNNASRNVEVIHLALFNHETLRVCFRLAYKDKNRWRSNFIQQFVEKKIKCLQAAKDRQNKCILQYKEGFFTGLRGAHFSRGRNATRALRNSGEKTL